MLNKTEEINLSLHRSIFHLLLNCCLQICSPHWRRKKKNDREKKKNKTNPRKEKRWKEKWGDKG